MVDLHQGGACLSSVDQYGMTCLHHAARFGHKDIVKYLVDQGMLEFLYTPPEVLSVQKFFKFNV